MKLCSCGCGTSLRKDNRTGYQKGHKPCPVCKTLVQGSGVECCSKSCSAKLHWQRNPDMRDSRIWNADRYATRQKNRDTWTKNLSDACKGRTPWNKNKKGSQIPWNKNLPAEQQPMFGKKKPDGWLEKYIDTNLSRYGEENVGHFAKTSPRSKKEKLLEEILDPNFEHGQKIGKWKPDYLNKRTRQIIEVYGDYWHCNPSLYAPTDYHSRLKMTAEQKWALDKQKVDDLTSQGYDVKIVWETDLDKFISKI